MTHTTANLKSHRVWCSLWSGSSSCSCEQDVASLVEYWVARARSARTPAGVRAALTANRRVAIGRTVTP